jgi:transposase-like protein
MRKERTHYTAEEKVAILRRHLLDKVPVSDLCEENGLQPTVFYRWQKEFFENGASAFQAKEHPARQIEEKQKRIEYLEKKVQTEPTFERSSTNSTAGSCGAFGRTVSAGGGPGAGSSCPRRNCMPSLAW